ncbi:MAG: UDP-N-acetylglucosamine 2-epimerase (non-hydrolyzing) [Chitinophagales bacterium]|nr:MAG: UDP-N-acetylglucosamine 2-epimerase (non-hydrolyzing) [Chitinophagales bacterium]
MAKKILTCVGTRPNFIKTVNLRELLEQRGFEYKLLHTGQHFDHNMSGIFFKELNLGEPDFHLNVKGSSNNEVVGKIILAMEPVIESYRPDLIMVPGDVNSTFACAFAASACRVPVAHIESGLRSFDRSMPEEINRILVDDLSDLLFVTEESGVQNLHREGKSAEKIKFVGNTMIDALVRFLPFIEQSDIRTRYNLSDYYLVTFHRPSNVDTENALEEIIRLLEEVSRTKQVVFPVHPRTRKRLAEHKVASLLDKPNIILTDPVGYLDFIHLLKYAAAVLTDSGGIQEESTYLGIPCLTIRPNTERPVTITVGTNTLVPFDRKRILSLLDDIAQGRYKTGRVPPLWDGKASERIAEEVRRFFA